MAELTEAQLCAKITAIDAQIATITGSLAGGTGGAQFTKYKIGQLEVEGQQQLDALIKSRELYQGLLEKIPKEVSDVSGYHVQVDGEDCSENLGDE